MSRFARVTCWCPLCSLRDAVATIMGLSHRNSTGIQATAFYTVQTSGWRIHNRVIKAQVIRRTILSQIVEIESRIRPPSAAIALENGSCVLNGMISARIPMRRWITASINDPHPHQSIKVYVYGNPRAPHKYDPIHFIRIQDASKRSKGHFGHFRSLN